jgi:hypothetical protein
MAESVSYDGTNASGLAQYLIGLLSSAETNRANSETKWNRNRAARNADADLDPLGTWKKNERKGAWKSKSVFGISKQKVQTAHAICMDAVFKDGVVPFNVILDEDAEAELAAAADPEVSVTVNREIQSAVSRLRRQLTETHATAEMMKVFDDGATYGEGWLHVVKTEIMRKRKVEAAPGVWTTADEPEDCMAGEYVSLWEMFRDMEAPDVQGGEFVIRRQSWSAWQIASINTPLVIQSAMKRVLERAKTCEAGSVGDQTTPDKNHEPPRIRDLPQRRRNIRMCEFWAKVPRAKVEAFERSLATEMDAGVSAPAPEPAADGEERDFDRVEVFALLAGDEIVAFQRDPGPRPFFRFTWDTNNDTPDGRGICDALESEQKALNGAVRAMENNAKLLTNLMLAVKREMMKSDPEKLLVDEGGVLDLDEDCEDARKAIQQIKFDSILNECVTIINMFMEFADLSSQIPRAQQGAQAANPQTAFELQQRLEMSGKYLGNVVRRFDEAIDWMVGIVHDYNQANTEIKDGKGPFTTKANGFTSFQNQVIRLNKLLQAMGMALQSPDLSKITRLRVLWTEILKAQDIDADAVVRTEEEIAEIDRAQAESEDRMIALEAARSKAAADGAHARLRDAQAAKTESEIGIERERLTTDRARAVVDIEDKIVARNNPDENGKSKSKSKGQDPTRKEKAK